MLYQQKSIETSVEMAALKYIGEMFKEVNT